VRWAAYTIITSAGPPDRSQTNQSHLAAGSCVCRESSHRCRAESCRLNRRRCHVHNRKDKWTHAAASFDDLISLYGQSRQMLKHYSHIRMQAKREALEAVSKKQQEAENKKKAEDAKRAQDCWPVSGDAQQIEGESLQKSLQLGVSGTLKHRKAGRKSLKRFGSSGRTRTYNPSVNSRMLYH
jgi:hypothetical protein